MTPKAKIFKNNGTEWLFENTSLGSKYYTKDWIPEIGCNDVRPRSYWYSHDRRDGESRRWNLRKGIWETVVLLLCFPHVVNIEFHF